MRVISRWVTKMVIMIRMSMVWSWKKISCSIIGDVAFWRVKFLQ
jgi:hypothetical protein